MHFLVRFGEALWYDVRPGMFVLIAIVGVVFIWGFLVLAVDDVIELVKKKRLERYMKTPAYKLEVAKGLREYALRKKREQAEQERNAILGAEREAQEAQELEDLKRRLREERAELALPLAERARKVELRQRMFEELVG